jgi:hypothetical protein
VVASGRLAESNELSRLTVLDLTDPVEGLHNALALEGGHHFAREDLEENCQGIAVAIDLAGTVGSEISHLDCETF